MLYCSIEIRIDAGISTRKFCWFVKCFVRNSVDDCSIKTGAAWYYAAV